ncbi:hypothetical protein B7463_g1701, partial [Scytalidium lignicola]
MGSNFLAQPWIQTPCIKSPALSREAGCNVYLKLENLQPSGSFKSRGIGNLILHAMRTRSPSKPLHFYCSSGGNAGLACATAALSLQQNATIVVPLSTSAFMVEKLKILGVEVIQIGNHWSEADAYLREELLAKDKDGIYVPPFDDPEIWHGNGTIIDEIEVQMRDEGGYDAVVCSVGGGGLFAGIMESLERHGRLRGGQKGGAKVLAMETDGTQSLAFSLKNTKLSRMDTISGIATSLGAAQVAKKAFEWAQRPEVVSCVFSDAEAAMGSVCFADDQRILVEAACGVSIAPAYNDTLASILFPEVERSEFEKLNIIIVVCGGSNEIQEATASEPLSLEEEYQMQHSWRTDHDKLTFIACVPPPSDASNVENLAPAIFPGVADAPERMIGDVNLFLSPADEDEEGCIGELELMIAPTSIRRQGYGRATILTFIYYLKTHLEEILTEYKQGKSQDKMSLLQLKVKVGSSNEKSIQLFESIGFIKVYQSPNYFGEFELILEEFLGEERIRSLLEKFKIEGYQELSSSADFFDKKTYLMRVICKLPCKTLNIVINKLVSTTVDGVENEPEWKRYLIQLNVSALPTKRGQLSWFVRDQAARELAKTRLNLVKKELLGLKDKIREVVQDEERACERKLCRMMGATEELELLAHGYVE